MTEPEDPTIPRPTSTAVGPRAGKPITKRRARRLAIEAGTHVPQGNAKRTAAPPPTEEQTRKVFAYVRAGNYLETAGAVAGVSRDVFRGWLERGNRPDAATKHPVEFAFAQGLEVAREQAIAASLATIEGASRPRKIETVTVEEGPKGPKTKTVTTEDRGAWQAAAWRLERMDPKRFALRVRLQVESEITAILDALERGLDAPTLDRVLEVIASIDSGPQ